MNPETLKKIQDFKASQQGGTSTASTSSDPVSKIKAFKQSQSAPKLTPDQIHLQNLQAQKSEKDRLDLTEQAKRTTKTDKTIGFFKDLVKGVGNQATRQGGNLLQAGNEAIQGLGFKGSEAPWMNSETESGKYAVGEGQAGTNLAQKTGAFGFGAASVFTPTPFGKLGLTGRIGNVAKAVTEGAQGDILLSGNIDPLTTLGLGALSGALSKGTNAIRGQKELTKAYELKAAGKIEEGQKAHQAYLTKIGLDTPEKIEAAKQLEIDNLDNILKSSVTGASKQLDLVNMPMEAKEVTLQNFAYARNPKTGKLDLTKSIQNINDQKQDTYGMIEDVASFLNKPGIISDEAFSITANSPMMRRIEDSISKEFVGGVDGATEFAADADKILGKVYEILQPTKRNKMSFDELNKIRMKANKSNDPEMKNAVDVIADAFRQQLELEVDILDKGLREGFLDSDKVVVAEAVDLFRKLNKDYGNLKDAEKITNAISKSKVDSGSRFEQMIGGIVATGGTYNPIGYALGSKAAEEARSIINSWSGKNIGAVSGSGGVNTSASNKLMEQLKSTPKNKTLDQILREEKGLQ